MVTKLAQNNDSTLDPIKIGHKFAMFHPKNLSTQTADASNLIPGTPCHLTECHVWWWRWSQQPRPWRSEPRSWYHKAETWFDQKPKSSSLKKIRSAKSKTNWKKTVKKKKKKKNSLSCSPKPTFPMLFLANPPLAPSARLQLRREKRGSPQMPWPLVQPLPTRVPMPTAMPRGSMGIFCLKKTVVTFCGDVWPKMLFLGDFLTKRNLDLWKNIRDCEKKIWFFFSEVRDPNVKDLWKTPETVANQTARCSVTGLPANSAWHSWAVPEGRRIPSWLSGQSSHPQSNLKPKTPSDQNFQGIT